MDVENVTLDFETDLIQISNIEYFEALFELISKHKNQASKYERSNNNWFLYGYNLYNIKLLRLGFPRWLSAVTNVHCGQSSSSVINSWIDNYPNSMRRILIPT